MTASKIHKVGMLSLLGFLFLIVGAPAYGKDLTRYAEDFLEGIKKYQEQDYPSAIRIFTELTEKGVTTGKLYYNLGNAHLKKGNLGHAILWYERAARLIPRDPDLKFNLSHARSLVKDKQDDSRQALYSILFFWYYRFSPRTVQYAALALNLLFWSILLARLFIPWSRLRLAGAFVGAVAIILTATAVYQFIDTSRPNQAVILPDKVSVRSGLTDQDTELFILHGGTKVKVEKTLDNHRRIFFSKGKIGWVQASDLGTI